MSTSWIDFGVVKEQGNFSAILTHYDITHSVSYGQVSVLCPFHRDTKPSLSVNMEGKWFHCFGCGAKGDILGFVAKLERVSFPEAARIIADCCGIRISGDNLSPFRSGPDVGLMKFIGTDFEIFYYEMAQAYLANFFGTDMNRNIHFR